MAPTKAEQVYYNAMQQVPIGEVGLVGAGLGGGFINTKELRVMKYNEAMQQPDADKWKEGVEREYERMEEHDVFKAVPIDEVPKGAKILSSTWAMKKKSNGTYRPRLNARGYEQRDGEHYDSHDVFAPVATETTIKVLFILAIMMKWYNGLIYVKDAFLHGNFEKG